MDNRVRIRKHEVEMVSLSHFLDGYTGYLSWLNNSGVTIDSKVKRKTVRYSPAAEQEASQFQAWLNGHWWAGMTQNDLLETLDRVFS